MCDLDLTGLGQIESLFGTAVGFQLGLASMVATHYLDFSDQDIDMLLTQQFQGMKRGLDRS